LTPVLITCGKMWTKNTSQVFNHTFFKKMELLTLMMHGTSVRNTVLSYKLWKNHKE